MSKEFYPLNDQELSELKVGQTVEVYIRFSASGKFRLMEVVEIGEYIVCRSRGLGDFSVYFNKITGYSTNSPGSFVKGCDYLGEWR